MRQAPTTAALATSSPRPSVIGNPVLGLLVAAMLIATWLFGFVSIAPNRILAGQPASLWVSVDGRLLLALGGEIALLVSAVVVRPAPRLHLLVVATASLLVVTIVAAAGAAATQVVAANPAARVSLGTAFWILMVAAGLAAADALHRLAAQTGLRFMLMLAVAVAISFLASIGRLDDLSLAREFAAREEAFAAESRRHVALVLAALLPALIIGAGLGALALRRPPSAGAIFATLNIVQTIPSIALFALLIEPLTSLSEAVPVLRDLGLRGIGPVPAVIALVLYSLLPIVRSIHAGFSGVPAAIIDAAKGMGMTGFQLWRDVALPLALPVLLAGLRIVTIQLIGLAVVAALIGAGGLGTFVFQGLGQTATDLVLLGALAAIGMALFVDGLFGSLAALVERRIHR